MSARVLVTGARDWPDRQSVRMSLDNVGFERGFEGLTIVHGDCPTGVDAFAAEWARDNADLGVTGEAHPADWSRGKKAGPERNTHMVSLGADLCLAFPLPHSRGTRDCMAKAQAAGIPTWTSKADECDHDDPHPELCQRCAAARRWSA